MRTTYAAIAALALTIAPLAHGADVSVLPLLELPPLAAVSTAGVDVDVMTARLAPMDEPVVADGLVVLQSWSDTDNSWHQNFRGNVVVQVPTKVPGFETLADAMDADVRLRFSRDGNVFAECRLAVQPIISRSAVYFAVELQAIDDDVKPLKGVCDVNMLDAGILGIQVGVPALDHGVTVSTIVVGKPFHVCDFMVGYCE